LVNDAAGPHGAVVCAAGSMPGDLLKLWRTEDPKGYHVEYGYSCMGYEIPGGLGIRMGDPDRPVFVMIGDGTYLLMNSEIVTAVQEGGTPPSPRSAARRAGRRHARRTSTRASTRECSSNSGGGSTHVQALKDLQPYRPPGPKPEWGKGMAARQRKTVVVCSKCHRAIH